MRSPGSGTFIVEAAIATLTGPGDKLLVLVNGAHGERMAAIARRLNWPVEILSWPEDRPVAPAVVERTLDADRGITHVPLVHCETTTGLLNPLAETAAIVARSGRVLLVDAMSSFGALPIDLRRIPITALMASSNKCLEGVPGLGFALVEQAALAGSRGKSPSPRSPRPVVRLRGQRAMSLHPADPGRGGAGIGLAPTGDGGRPCRSFAALW